MNKKEMPDATSNGQRTMNAGAVTATQSVRFTMSLIGPVALGGHNS